MEVASMKPLRNPQLFLIGLCICFASPTIWALEINDDGRALILEAQQSYLSDMENRPVITDTAITSYATNLVTRLAPKEIKPPLASASASPFLNLRNRSSIPMWTAISF
jgi:hypothetical protein